MYAYMMSWFDWIPAFAGMTESIRVVESVEMTEFIGNPSST